MAALLAMTMTVLLHTATASCVYPNTPAALTLPPPVNSTAFPTKSVSLSFPDPSNGNACLLSRDEASLKCYGVAPEYTNQSLSGIKTSTGMLMATDLNLAATTTVTDATLICAIGSGGSGWCKVMTQAGPTLTLSNSSNHVSWTPGATSSLSATTVHNDTALVCYIAGMKPYCGIVTRTGNDTVINGSFVQMLESSRVAESTNLVTARIDNPSHDYDGLVCYPQWDQTGIPQRDHHGIIKPWETDRYIGTCKAVSLSGAFWDPQVWYKGKERPYNLVATTVGKYVVLCWRENNDGKCRLWNPTSGFSQDPQTFSSGDVRPDTLAVTTASEGAVLICYVDKGNNAGNCKYYSVDGNELKQYNNKVVFIPADGPGKRIGVMNTGSLTYPSTVAGCYGTWIDSSYSENRQYCVAIDATKSCIASVDSWPRWKTVLIVVGSLVGLGLVIGAAVAACCVCCKKREPAPVQTMPHPYLEYYPSVVYTTSPGTVVGDNCDGNNSVGGADCLAPQCQEQLIPPPSRHDAGQP